MAESIRYFVFLCVFMAGSTIRCVSSSSLYVSMCHPQSKMFIHDLWLQCPDTISPSSPIEMDAESLDRTLNSSPVNVYTAVLFYASWCPFSSGMLPKFAALSSMFPHIKHIMVEQSAAMPSVFSRYGVHSLPSIMIVNKTAKVQYHEQKDLHSLVHFYKRTTGLDRVVLLTEDQGSLSESDHEVLEPWKRNSMKEILVREPYLVFSALFLLFRAVLYFFPQKISHLIALWCATIPRLNLGIFGESRQVLGRVLNLIDLKRMWSKLKLCNTRNFHNGARSARVWASSLASVSLGETSLGKPFTSEES